MLKCSPSLWLVLGRLVPVTPLTVPGPVPRTHWATAIDPSVGRPSSGSGYVLSIIKYQQTPDTTYALPALLQLQPSANYNTYNTRTRLFHGVLQYFCRTDELAFPISPGAHLQNEARQIISSGSPARFSYLQPSPPVSWFLSSSSSSSTSHACLTCRAF